MVRRGVVYQRSECIAEEGDAEVRKILVGHGRSDSIEFDVEGAYGGVGMPCVLWEEQVCNIVFVVVGAARVAVGFDAVSRMCCGMRAARGTGRFGQHTV